MNDNFTLTLQSIVSDIDTSAAPPSSSKSVGNVIELIDGSNYLSLSGLSFTGNSFDYLFGFKISLRDDYNGSVPNLFQQDMYLDYGFLRQFIQIDNINYDISNNAVPSLAYAVADINYTYNYLDDDGNENTVYNASNILNLQVDVYNSNFFAYGGHNSHIRVHGYDFQDVESLNQQGYFGEIASGSVGRFGSSVKSLDIYVFYSANDFYNFVSDLPLNLNTDTPLNYYCGFQNIDSIPFSLNLYTDANTFGDTDKYSFKSLSTGLVLMMSEISNNLGSVVTNATENANRIIQNTTQKVDEVKQGVTEVKDSVVETKNSILDLPNKIKDMLIGLVVPDDETINAKYAEFDELLASRFGLIYQSADIIHDFAESFQTQAVMTADTGGIITLPSVTVNLAGTAFTFGGYEVDIIPDGFEQLQTAVRLAVSMVCTVVFVNMCKNKLEAILK